MRRSTEFQRRTSLNLWFTKSSIKNNLPLNPLTSLSQNSTVISTLKCLTTHNSNQVSTPKMIVHCKTPSKNLSWRLVRAVQGRATITNSTQFWTTLQKNRSCKINPRTTNQTNDWAIYNSRKLFLVKSTAEEQTAVKTTILKHLIRGKQIRCWRILSNKRRINLTTQTEESSTRCRQICEVSRTR
jgi:hypothetical protein